MKEQTNLVRVMNYTQYRQLLDDLMLQNKTTGHDQSEDFIHYAKMNLQRMNRLEKTVVLNEALKAELQQLAQPVHLLALTEGWCGDAAQNLPVFKALEDFAPTSIQLELVLRDENLTLMDRYLTNGGRAIPKVIATYLHTGEEAFVWGPRPEACQQIMLTLKEKNANLKEKAEAIHGWYAKDKTQSTQAELYALFEKINRVRPI